MKKVGIYLRNAIENKEEIEFKKEKAIRLSKEKGWEIFKVYIDNGFSGNDINRPSLQEALEDVINKHIDILFPYDISMLSRNTGDILYIVNILRENKIDLMKIERDKVVEVDYNNTVIETSISNTLNEEIEKMIESKR